MTVAAPVLTVRVSTVRRQNPYGRGGAIFTGIGVDDKGWRTDAKTHYVIKASGQMLQAPVERGQVWRVVGTPELHTIVVNGYRLTEATVTPEAMELVRPSGEHIISLPLREAREMFEREYLVAQINRFGGNISRTAAFIGMERSALHRKLKTLGVGSRGDEIAS